MKRLIFVLFLLGFTSLLFAQTESPIPYAPQSVSEPVNGANFKLFPTYNYWTFLELDTRSGWVWRVQFSLKEEEGYRYKEIISLETLASGEDAVSGRFTIYPTRNRFNYILLDQIDGRCWQLQYGNKDNENFLIRIY
jgi:hypothetical protein